MMQPGGRPPNVAARQLASEMHRLYEDSNTRTYESLAQRLGSNRKSVTNILQGKSLPPSRDFIPHLVNVCVADDKLRQRHIDHLSSLWEEARAEERNRRIYQFSAPKIDIEGFEKSWLSATWYGNNREFYSAAKEYVEAAREQIRVTYVRQAPPTQVTSPEAKAYFAAILDWAREPGHGEVTRVIGVPIPGGRPEVSFLKWLQDHHEETSEIHHYAARVITWTSRADGLNMALFDEDTSFLAVSGQGGHQKLTGLSLDSPQFTQYLSAHFDQLWHASEPLGSYLVRVTSGD